MHTENLLRESNMKYAYRKSSKGKQHEVIKLEARIEEKIKNIEAIKSIFVMKTTKI